MGTISSQFRLIDYICNQLATRVFGSIAGRQTADGRDWQADGRDWQAGSRDWADIHDKAGEQRGNKSGLWTTGKSHITASES